MSTQMINLPMWLLAGLLSLLAPGCQTGGGGGGAGGGGDDGTGDQRVASGEMVTLTPPETESGEGAATYQWTQVEGPTVDLDDPTARNPSFPAPQVEEATVLKFEVDVTTGGTTLTFDVVVNVEPDTAEQGVIGGAGTASDLPGTWESTDHNSTLVIASDGSVLTERVLKCVIPCDGERYPCDLGTESEFAIDPYKLTVGPGGRITMEEHEIRQYMPAGNPDPSLTYQTSGEGRLDSPNSMSLETLKEPWGLRQQWTYTKVAD